MVAVVLVAVLDWPCVPWEFLDNCRNKESISFSASRNSRGMGVHEKQFAAMKVAIL